MGVWEAGKNDKRSNLKREPPWRDNIHRGGVEQHDKSRLQGEDWKKIGKEGGVCNTNN